MGRLAASLQDTQIREDERRQALARQQDRERGQLHERQEQRQRGSQADTAINHMVIPLNNEFSSSNSVDDSHYLLETLFRSES